MRLDWIGLDWVGLNCKVVVPAKLVITRLILLIARTRGLISASSVSLFIIHSGATTTIYLELPITLPSHTHTAETCLPFQSGHSSLSLPYSSFSFTFPSSVSPDVGSSMMAGNCRTFCGLVARSAMPAR